MPKVFAHCYHILNIVSNKCHPFKISSQKELLFTHRTGSALYRTLWDSPSIAITCLPTEILPECSLLKYVDAPSTILFFCSAVSSLTFLWGATLSTETHSLFLRTKGVLSSGSCACMLCRPHGLRQMYGAVGGLLQGRRGWKGPVQEAPHPFVM